MRNYDRKAYSDKRSSGNRKLKKATRKARRRKDKLLIQKELKKEVDISYPTSNWQYFDPWRIF